MSSNMPNEEIAILKRALERQKKARIKAEKILEEKSKELYDTAEHLKRANTRLKNFLDEKSEEMDSAFLDLIDPYVVMNLDFDVIRTNDSAKEFLGFDYEKESLNLATLVHPDYLQYTKESMQSLLKVGVLKNYRARIYTKNGQAKYVQINASLLYNTAGRPIAAQGIIRDITQEMEVKTLLSEQRKQLDIIVENSPLGIVLSHEGRIVRANSAFSNMLGYSERELKEMRIVDFTYKEDNETSKNLMLQLDSGQLDKFTLQKKYIRKDGSLLSAKITVNSLKMDSNETGYQVAVIEDITKEKEAEERLRAERKKYVDIIANMNLGLIEVDTEERIQMVNQSFCTMSGFAEEELVGQKASTVLSVQNREVIEQKNARRLENISDSYELEVKHKSGTIRHWLISGAPRYDESGTVIGSIGIHLDITEQKQLQLQKEQLLGELQLSNKELQEYAHIVSHDLKSPLRSINTLVSWLKEDYAEVLDENGIRQLQMMQEKVESMDKLISGILRYSSIGRKTSEKTQVDCQKIVENIKEIIFVPDHVRISIVNPLPIIVADKTKIHQLFQNLLSNAVSHIEKKQGLVTIASQDLGLYWQFSISDNGVGISKEYHEKIFKVFQSLSTNQQSTGIGLSIVKKIVDVYQGTIWLESEVGRGTTFYFTLKKECL